MLRRNHDEFRIPLFLEERPPPRVPKYSKEVFREVYEPACIEDGKSKSRLQKWVSALKKRLTGKKADQLSEDNSFISRQTETCSQCSLRERGGRPRGMLVERRRPVSMYDFRLSHQEKVLTLTPHSDTATYTSVISQHKPYPSRDSTHYPDLPDASLILPAVLVRVRRKGEAAREQHDGQAIRYRQHRRFSVYSDPDSDTRRQRDTDHLPHSYTCSARPYSCIFEPEPDVVVSAQPPGRIRTSVPVRPEWTNRVTCAPERKVPPGTRKRFGGKRLLVLDDAALMNVQNGVGKLEKDGVSGMGKMGKHRRTNLMHEAIYEEVMI